MLANNVNLEERLINGEMGTIQEFKYDRNVKTRYVQVDDERARLGKMQSDFIAFWKNLVTIHKNRN